MTDWYSAYLSIQAREHELALAAERERRLAETRSAARRARETRRLRVRLGQVLIRAGRALQGVSPSLAPPLR